MLKESSFMNALYNDYNSSKHEIRTEFYICF